MGLFGGFKAKFTRNSEEKKPEQIVVLKYRSFSEFDSDYTCTPSSREKEPTVVRHRSHPRRPTAYPFNTHETSSASTTSIQKSSSFHNSQNEFEVISILPKINQHKSIHTEDNKSRPLTISNSFKSLPQTSTFSQSVLEDNNTLKPNAKAENGTESPPDTSVGSSYSPEKNQQFSTISKSLPQIHVHEDPNQISKSKQSSQDQHDSSTLIFMTQHSPEIRDREGGAEAIADNLVDEDDFKVNVVKHSSTADYSDTEDDTSYQEDTKSEDLPLGYSSQAASIFFGNDVSPTFSRPRRVRIRDNDSEDEDC